MTGGAPFNPRHPAFPVTPQQIAAACVEAAHAGAAITHIHVRDPKTGAAAREPKLFKETVDRLRDSGTEVIINLTGGLGGFLLPDPADERRALPASDVCSVDERMEHLELPVGPRLPRWTLRRAIRSRGRLNSSTLNTDTDASRHGQAISKH